MPPIDPIAEAVNEELRRRETSIRELGRITSVGYPTISRWLAGERSIKLDDRSAILEALDLELIVRRRRAPS